MAYRKETVETYSAYETSPTPFTTQSLNGLVVISDRPFTPLAFRKPQSDMTGFAIGMSFVYGETFKVSIPTQSELSCNNNSFKNNRQEKKHNRRTFRIGGKSTRRRKERISTFSAEKVLCMIRPLAKRRIVETDKLFLDNGGLARVTFGSKVLFSTGVNNMPR